jgi:putative transcriptional regulator
VPQLGDPNFQRSVVLMMEHSSEGAFGVVVNRPGRMTLGEVGATQGMDVEVGCRDERVFVGGPVQPERGFVLHARPELPESVALVPGLWVSSSIDVLRLLLGAGGQDWRLCLGFAGWGPGQLENELREGAWLTTPATPAHVLTTAPRQAWESVIRDMGIEPGALLHASGLH